MIFFAMTDGWTSPSTVVSAIAAFAAIAAAVISWLHYRTSRSPEGVAGKLSVSRQPFPAGMVRLYAGDHRNDITDRWKLGVVGPTQPTPIRYRHALGHCGGKNATGEGEGELTISANCARVFKGEIIQIGIDVFNYRIEEPKFIAASNHITEEGSQDDYDKDRVHRLRDSHRRLQGWCASPAGS